LFLLIPRPPTSTSFPYTTLFRSGPERLDSLLRFREIGHAEIDVEQIDVPRQLDWVADIRVNDRAGDRKRGLLRIVMDVAITRLRSEEHTSELQSLTNLVCRLLLE